MKIRGWELRNTQPRRFLTMVAVDDDGNPLVVPPVVAESEVELRRQREANVRREERVWVRQRIEGEAG